MGLVTIGVVLGAAVAVTASAADNTLDLAPAADTFVEHWRDGQLPATVLRMNPERFAIFLPNELHRPQIFDGTHPDVRKLVVKIGAHRLGM